MQTHRRRRGGDAPNSVWVRFYRKGAYRLGGKAAGISAEGTIRPRRGGQAVRKPAAISSFGQNSRTVDLHETFTCEQHDLYRYERLAVMPAYDFLDGCEKLEEAS